MGFNKEKRMVKQYDDLDEDYDKCYDEYMKKFDLATYKKGHDDLHNINLRGFNYWLTEVEAVVLNGADRVVDKFLFEKNLYLDEWTKKMDDIRLEEIRAKE